MGAVGPQGGGLDPHLATSALGATVAGATTHGVGRAAIAYMERGTEISGDELRSVFDEAAFAWKNKDDE